MSLVKLAMLQRLEDGSYALVIKFTDTFDVDFGDESGIPQQNDPAEDYDYSDSLSADL